MNPKIIFEDNHLLVVNKPPGMLSQGDSSGDLSLIDHFKNLIKKRDKKTGNVFLGLPHRLDRPTSGIIVLAKTSKALRRLNKIFSKKEIIKIYWVIVEGKPANDKKKLTHYLKRNRKINKSFVVNKDVKESKKSELVYKVLKKFRHYSLLEVELLTGRHHQIRAQLKHVNLIIKGDIKYGSKRTNKNGCINLHAKSISFKHPVSKVKLNLDAPFFDDIMWNKL